jgi:hypothetical protein
MRPRIRFRLMRGLAYFARTNTAYVVMAMPNSNALVPQRAMFPIMSNLLILNPYTRSKKLCDRSLYGGAS